MYTLKIVFLVYKIANIFILLFYICIRSEVMNPLTYSNFSIYNQFPYSSSSSVPYWRGIDYSPEYTEYGESNDVASNTAKTAGLAALLQTMAVALQKGSQWFANKLQAGKEFTSEDNVRKIADKMLVDNKIQGVTVGYINDANKHYYQSKVPNLANEIEVVSKGQNAFYTDEVKLAVAPKSKPSLILHELGHACNAKNWFLKLLQKSRKYAMAAPTALLIASNLLGKDSDGRDNFIARNAGKLGFMAFLPTIIEEAAASLRGIKAIDKVPKNLLKGTLDKSILKRNYFCALATYIIAGLGLGVASRQMILENKNSRM